MSLLKEDLLVIAIALVGIVLIITQLYLNDWDIMKLLFIEEETEEEPCMKKAERIYELEVGQTIYTDEKAQNSYVIKSLEDKLVPYIVATDNSSHSPMRGIWFSEQR